MNDSINSKIKSIDELAKVVDKAKGSGKVIVSTNGCFDLLHVGHLRYLQAAKSFGDILIVAINSDSSTKAIKGANRPIIPESERAELLAGLECVDYVTIFEQTTPIETLLKLKPDIHVKGGDYTMERIIERQAVESYGGKVIIAPHVPGRSTSEVIKLISKRW
jgi:rfaE bifunctional protein nucleotidyltransferase chain/domain